MNEDYETRYFANSKQVNTFYKIILHVFSIVFVIVWHTLNDSFVNHFNQMEDVVFIILQIFFATCAVLKIGKYHLDVAQVMWHV